MYETIRAPLACSVTRSGAAARLVVEGVHSKGWTREQALKYMHDTPHYPASDRNGSGTVTSAWPGQALSYYMASWRSCVPGKKRRNLGAKSTSALSRCCARARSVPLPVVTARIDRSSLKMVKGPYRYEVSKFSGVHAFGSGSRVRLKALSGCVAVGYSEKFGDFLGVGSYRYVRESVLFDRLHKSKEGMPSVARVAGVLVPREREKEAVENIRDASVVFSRDQRNITGCRPFAKSSHRLTMPKIPGVNHLRAIKRFAASELYAKASTLYERRHAFHRDSTTQSGTRAPWVNCKDAGLTIHSL